MTPQGLIDLCKRPVASLDVRGLLPNAVCRIEFTDHRQYTEAEA
jgi:hypothetical protein